MKPRTPGPGMNSNPFPEENANGAVDPEVLPPTGNAFPIHRPAPGVMMRRETIFAGAIGVALGVGLTLWIMKICSSRKN